MKKTATAALLLLLLAGSTRADWLDDNAVYGITNLALLDPVLDISGPGQVINGYAVGPTARPGIFQKSFEPIYQHGTETYFVHMTTNENASVRAMGLLCLTYKNKTLATNCYDKVLKHDTNQVNYVEAGCIIQHVPFRQVAQNIMTNLDFFRTRRIAERVDAKRK